MDRLTEKNDTGGNRIKDCEIRWRYVDVIALQRAIDRLAQYEDAEAEGRLVVLPCKVGDTVYKIVTLCSGDEIIVVGKIAEFARNYSGDEVYFSEPNRKYDIWCDVGYFGKTVFLTREEAEKVSKEGTADATKE